MEDRDHKHNFHTHTFRCKHAKGDVDDYCRRALELGMETLGFSDHTALPDDRWLVARSWHFGRVTILSYFLSIALISSTIVCIRSVHITSDLHSDLHRDCWSDVIHR